MTNVSDQTDLYIDVEAKLLNELLQPARTLTQDSNAVFRWYQDRVEIGTVDGANTIKVHQVVKSNHFESYNSDYNGYAIGVKCDRLSNILSSLEPTEIVSLKINPETNQLTIYFNQGQYEMGGVDIQSIREPSETQLTLRNEIRIHKYAFDQAYQIIGMASDEIVIEITEDTVRFFGRGDTDDAEISLSVTTEDDEIKKNEVVYKKPVSEIVMSKYEKSLIDDLRKFIPDQHMDMKIANGQPLEVFTKRSDDRIETQIVVAPKVTP